MSDAPFLPPPIEPVQQVTLEPLRPKATWYWVGGIVAAVAVALAAFLFVRGIFGFIGQIDDFSRVDVPGSEVVRLGEGEWVLYHEPPGNRPASLSYVDVEVSSVPDEVSVPVSASGGTMTYADGSREGESIGRFDVPTEGNYRITVDDSFDADGELAVGRPLFDTLVPWLLGSVAVGGLGLLAGIIIVTVVAVKRGRAKRLRRPPVPPGPFVAPGYASPYPAYGGAPPGYGAPQGYGAPPGYGVPPPSWPPPPPTPSAGEWGAPPAPPPPPPTPPDGFDDLPPAGPSPIS